MANIRVLATDLEFPEGPVVMPDGSVVLVEIRGQAADAGLSRRPQGGGRANSRRPQWRGARPRRQMYICNNGGFSWIPTGTMIMPGPQPEEFIGGSIQRVDLESGKVETVFDKCGEHPLRGPERPGVR